MRKAALGIVVVVFLFSSCEMLTGLFEKSKPVYISVDGTYGSHSCALTLVTYVEPNASSGNGKNITSDFSTITKNGRDWKVYSIPAEVWDVYVEYYRDGATFFNYRARLNLADNDWGAVYINKNIAWCDDVDDYQGRGDFSMPALPGL